MAIHIGKNGPEKCPAKVQCRLKGPDGNPVPHFDSIEEAQKHIDTEGAKNAFSNLNNQRKNNEIEMTNVVNKLQASFDKHGLDWQNTDEAQELAHEWKESFAESLHEETGWGESHIEVMMEIDTPAPDELANDSVRKAYILKAKQEINRLDEIDNLHLNQPFVDEYSDNINEINDYFKSLSDDELFNEHPETEEAIEGMQESMADMIIEQTGANVDKDFVMKNILYKEELPWEYGEESSVRSMINRSRRNLVLYLQKS